MPLSDSDADRLCRGRVVYLTDVVDSSGDRRAGPHLAVLIDDTADIQRTGRSTVVVISHNDQIDSVYLAPIPARFFLTGNFVCSWRPVVHENQIDRLHLQPEMNGAELLPIWQMIARHRADTQRRRRG